MKTIRILIVDDQPMFAEGLKFIFDARASNIEVVGIAKNGEEAILQTRKHRPAIVLMDVRMPVLDGVRATRQIIQEMPDTKIVMLTTFDDDTYVKQALKEGAVGYLLKSHQPSELIHSIEAVNDGILQLDPGVARTLLNRDDPTGTSRPELIEDDVLDEIRSNLSSLSAKEREVLLLMVQAFDNKRMAKNLNVTEQTIRNYVSHIYAKLGSTNRIAIVRAIERLEF